VTVTFDESSARYQDCVGSSFQCTRSITADAQLKVTSADGAFADGGSVPVTFLPGAIVPGIYLRVRAEDLGGALSISSNQEGSESSLTYEVMAMGSACQGELSLGLSIPNPDGHGMTSFDGAFGSWSGNGCPPGAVPEDLSATTFQSAITEEFASRTFRGEWEDGEPAGLTVTVSSVPQVLCTETSPYGNPATMADVRLNYGMGDSRLAPDEIPAALRVTDRPASGKLLQISAATETVCDSPDTVLPYSPFRCGEGIDRVRVEFQINEALLEPTEPSDVKVTVYEYRTGTNPLDPADAVHEFVAR